MSKNWWAAQSWPNKIMIGFMGLGLAIVATVVPVQNWKESQKMREFEKSEATERRRLQPLFAAVEKLRPSVSSLESDRKILNNFLMEACYDFDKQEGTCLEWAKIQGNSQITTEQRAVIKNRLDEISAIDEELRLAAKDQAIRDGTYMPSELEVGRACKSLAKEAALTKRVDWGFLGLAGSKWIPERKTIILEGRSQNAFGVDMPFSIECRWEKGGIVRVVDIAQ